jgi:hypothetical protein
MITFGGFWLPGNRDSRKPAAVSIGVCQLQVRASKFREAHDDKEYLLRTARTNLGAFHDSQNARSFLGKTRKMRLEYFSILSSLLVTC